MRSLLLFAGMASVALLFGQAAPASEPYVALYVDTVPDATPSLSVEQRTRIKDKLMQAAARTGTVHVGLSSFLLYASGFAVLESVPFTGGMQPMVTTKCELTLAIARLDDHENPLFMPGTVFGSKTLTLMGTGRDVAASQTDAINRLNSADPQLATLIRETKVKILEYYNVHCDEVLKEADRYHTLRAPAMAIALYYSVPEGARCYERARASSMKAYEDLMLARCNRELLVLKAMNVFQRSAEVPEKDKQSQYREALEILKRIHPSNTTCYDQALALLQEAAAQFDAQNAQAWEQERARMTTEGAVEKEAWKAIATIHAAQRPGVVVIEP